MKKWNELSMYDKAAYIKIGIQNGVADLSSIRGIYNKYAEGGDIEGTDTEGTDYIKPWYWLTPSYEGATLKEALFKAVDQGREGKNILYKGNAYKVELSDKDKIEYQHYKNRSITDEDIVDSYIDGPLYTMENPQKKGFSNGRWKVYTDKDANGVVARNYGPGINENSDIGKLLDYNSKRGYTTEELNELIRGDLLEKANSIRKDLYDMYGEDIDTMSLGNRLVLLDIAHNVRPRGKKRANMPKAWPKLVKGMTTGNANMINSNLYSGSTRRAEMRKDLVWKNEVDENTVKNR